MAMPSSAKLPSIGLRPPRSRMSVEVGGPDSTLVNTEQRLGFYCRSHWLVDLVLSGLSTPYQIYRTNIEYLNGTRTW